MAKIVSFLLWLESSAVFLFAYNAMNAWITEEDTVQYRLIRRFFTVGHPDVVKYGLGIWWNGYWAFVELDDHCW